MKWSDVDWLHMSLEMLTIIINNYYYYFYTSKIKSCAHVTRFVSKCNNVVNLYWEDGEEAKRGSADLFRQLFYIKRTDNYCMFFRFAGVQGRLWSPRPGWMLFWEGYSGTSWERSTGPMLSPKRSKWSSVRSGWVLIVACTNLLCHKRSENYLCVAVGYLHKIIICPWWLNFLHIRSPATIRYEWADSDWARHGFFHAKDPSCLCTFCGSPR